jgi:AbrB family looped-hinge helix DNA binding protein
MLAQKIHVDSSGRLLVPAKVRSAMGIKHGGDLMFRFKNNKITIDTLDKEIDDLHRIWAKYKSDVPLMEDLKQMREEDASKE